MAKSWILIFVMTILRLKTSKTQIATNTRALIYLGLHGSVAERIKHEGSAMLTYRKKSSNPQETDSSLRSAPAINHQ